MRYRDYRIEKLMKVEGLKIKKVVIDQRSNEVLVKGQVERPRRCPHCDEISLHETTGKTLKVKHKDLYEQPVYIEYYHANYRCHSKTCGLCYTPTPEFKVYTQHYSDYFVEQVVKAVRRSDLKSVSKDFYEHYSNIERIYYGYLQHEEKTCEIPWHCKNIGIDEIAMKKGHRDFVLLVYDLDKGIVLDVLKDRKKKTLKQYLKSLPQFTLDEIECVCIDMCKHYKDVIQEVLPTVDIVIDRFHVSRELGKAVKKVRKDLVDSGQLNALSGKQRQMLYHAVNFSEKKLNKKPKYKKVLELACRICPRLKQVVELRREFKRIFDSRANNSISKLRYWVVKVEKFKSKFMTTFLKTYSNWRPFIENYIKTGYTNAVAEGLNNKIKMIKRMAFGFRSFTHFRLRILHTSGLLGYRNTESR